MMMKIKRILILAVLLLAATVRDAGAQSLSAKKSDIRIDPQAVLQIGDSLLVDVLFEIEMSDLGTRDQLILTPVVKSGENEQELPSVLINGPVRQKAVRRMEKITGRQAGYYTSLRIGRRGLDENFRYRVRVPFRSWMRDAQVMLVERECDCQSNYSQLAVQRIADHIEYLPRPEFTRQFAASVPFLAPPHEEIKQRAESGEAYIIYKVGSSAITPSLANNNEELQKVTRSISYVNSEPTARISGITITSYASPEGTWQYNLSLSQRRARNFVTWFRSHNNVGYDVPLKADGYGEDWKRLEDMVRADGVLTPAEKSEVLSVIASTDDMDRKETRIKQVGGGSAYRHIFENSYPILRRTEYRIEYTVPEFTLEKSRELFRTHPEMLSLAEFYALAAEYPKGSEPFVEVFEVAARVNPGDRLADLNAAAAMLQGDKLISARRILEGYAEEPQAWVYIGILEAKEEKFDLADGYFRNAVQEGISEAEPLLLELERHQRALDEYGQRLQEWQGYE